MLKKLLVTLFSLTVCFSALTAADNSADKGAVTMRLKEFATAYNNGNLDQIGSYWTKDAEVTSPITGEMIDGNSAVVDYLKSRYEQSKGRELTFTIGSLEISEPNLATVKGILELSDKTNGMLIYRAARKIELVKQNGTWYLDTLSEIPIELTTSAYDHLKDIAWLVGKWNDTDDNVSITFTAKWDKHQNFLTQAFSLKVYGFEEMDGMQIIGWDPIEKKIRSWVYDSDGGFGSGYWTQNGKEWNVNLAYVLSDGKRAYATNIYSKTDANHYTYSSINRKVDNISLPNIEPVTVVREE